MKRPYIGYVEISDKMAEKLITRRGLAREDGSGSRPPAGTLAATEDQSSKQ
jgi:hypothetical protein